MSLVDMMRKREQPRMRRLDGTARLRMQASGAEAQLLHRAEHEISYSAKRAIEMYLPVFEQEAAFYLFLKCAEQYHLSATDIEACRTLMREFWMIEEDET